jgi:hypothetical protein
MAGLHAPIRSENVNVNIVNAARAAVLDAEKLSDEDLDALEAIQTRALGQ